MTAIGGRQLNDRDVAMNPADYIQQFATIFAVVDPIGTIPVYIAATASIPVERRRGVAVKGVLIAASVLLLFIVAGQLVLDSIGVSIVSFQIGGGIVLLLFALTMIFGTTKPDAEKDLVKKSNMELAVFPLAMPSLASPGALTAVVLLTDNRTNSLVEQSVIAGLMILVMAIALALLLVATKIQKLIGNAGAAIISQIMGLILVALAVEIIASAVGARFALPIG